ncbi:MAG TPA: permease-like cell division protein FtsX [Solirubrobacterales bacterium]|jgi:cell division transport system permease protein|nr:permease-like cell division protein FtsX [Solirubrobacterales bacterium]
MGRIVFFFQEALRALKRNGAPSLAAIVTTVVTVVLLGMLIPIFQTAQGKSEEVRSQLSVQYALFPDATKAEIGATKRKLEGIPHVAEVNFIGKAQALKSLETELEDKRIVEELKFNPLPNSFEVKPDDAANLPAIQKAVFPNGPKGQPFSSIINNEFDRTFGQKKVEQVTSALKIILTVITALLVLASLMLIGNTIRLSIYTRRREVEVMRLVGATRWFIRWPFVIEGVVVGFAGGLLAILILWLGKITIVDPLSDSVSVLSAQSNSTLGFPALIAILFAASILVSTIGSGVTLRRFLKV